MDRVGGYVPVWHLAGSFEKMQRSFGYGDVFPVATNGFGELREPAFYEEIGVNAESIYGEMKDEAEARRQAGRPNGKISYKKMTESEALGTPSYPSTGRAAPAAGDDGLRVNGKEMKLPGGTKPGMKVVQGGREVGVVGSDGRVLKVENKRDGEHVHRGEMFERSEVWEGGVEEEEEEEEGEEGTVEEI